MPRRRAGTNSYVGTWHWHTFNIADSAITVGIALMALDVLLDHRRGATEDEPEAAAESGR